MAKQTAIKFFSFIFLFIFFCKMVISVSPLVAVSFDSKSILAVIMQLEIENHSEKETSENTKEALVKGEGLVTLNDYKFIRPSVDLNSKLRLMNDEASQPFYPKVPTPPPSI